LRINVKIYTLNKFITLSIKIIKVISKLTKKFKNLKININKDKKIRLLHTSLSVFNIISKKK